MLTERVVNKEFLKLWHYFSVYKSEMFQCWVDWKLLFTAEKMIGLKTALLRLYCMYQKNIFCKFAIQCSVDTYKSGR